MNQVWRRCPVCDDAASRPHWRKPGVSLVQCRSCGMVFANPILADLADGAHYAEAAARYHLSPAKLGGDFAPVRYDRELRLFRRYCPSGRVLDVGCSTGAFLHQLQRLGGYEVLGTDVAGPALDHAAQLGIPTLRSRFLEHDFGGQQFDAITFWAVLEHVAEPAAFLRKAADIAIPGGWCFVLVPNLRSLAVRLLGPRYRYVMPEHVNYFTNASLQALALQAPELEVTRVAGMHFNPVVLWEDWRSGGAEPAEAQRAALLQRTTAWKQSAWLKPARLAYRMAEAGLGAFGLADNLIMVLRRKAREVARRQISG